MSPEDYALVAVIEENDIINYSDIGIEQHSDVGNLPVKRISNVRVSHGVAERISTRTTPKHVNVFHYNDPNVGYLIQKSICNIYIVNLFLGVVFNI